MWPHTFPERLASWAHLRTQAASLPLDQSLAAINSWWFQTPWRPYHLHWDDVETWPDPWQLIEENTYCDLAKTLGIVYTLYLTSHKKELCPEIRIYFDPRTNYCYHIAYLCHGKYVLNLIEGEVVNKEHINQQLKLKYRYTAIDLRLEQY
jgi:hypothetical protein